MSKICETMLEDASKLQCLNDTMFWSMVQGAGFALAIVVFATVLYVMCKE